MLVDMVGPCFSELQRPPYPVTGLSQLQVFFGDGMFLLFNPFLVHYMRYVHFTQHQASLDAVDLTTDLCWKAGCCFML